MEKLHPIPLSFLLNPCSIMNVTDKIKIHCITPYMQVGARGLILSPTRELALQTLKFTKEVITETHFLIYFLKFNLVISG